MKKRILALLLCALLVLGGLPTMAKQPESSDVSQRFFDVKKTDWFYKNGALQFVCDNQWFAGTSDTTFGPNEPMTRAMFVTVLGRMAGISVDHSFSIAFRDVPKNTYYTGYVRWANSNGIVYGVENDCFAPGDYITREQICVMLMRYCKYADLYLQTAAKPVVFADAKNISGYAREGVAWCQRAGVINGEKVGTGYLFRPQGLATRAEVATMMMNFWQNRWKGSNTDTVCMSFNVLEWDTRYTGYATPQTRAPWIVDTIRRYNPDLLGMQEVTKGSATTLNFDMCSYLTDELKDQYAYRTLMDEKGKSGSTVVVNKLTIASGLIVFWKKDRFELKDSGAMVYSNDGVRHFQWVKLYDRQEDVTVIMTNTHFSINPSSDVTAGAGLRLTQANELYNFWNAQCEDGMALYGTGAYNHTTDATAYQALNKGKFVSARDVSAKANANSAIDYIYINGDVQSCSEYIRCNETYEPEGVPKGEADNRNVAYCPSDHYAIVAVCDNQFR